MKLKLPVLPNLEQAEAHLLIELIDWVIEALLTLQCGLRRTYGLHDPDSFPNTWDDDIPF